MPKDKPHILYVDDEESNLRIFKTTFKRDYKIHLALTAKEGLDILKQEPVSIIVADQKMPETTGVEFLTEALVSYPAPTRMILTGFSDLEAVIQAINRAKVYKYATKPWNKSELKPLLDDALEHYQERIKLREALANANQRISELEVQLNRNQLM